MRITVLLFLLLALSFMAHADGWRKGEMEVQVTIRGHEDLDRVKSLHLNGDAGRDYAILYVTPEELQKIKEAGLDYKIRIADLNEHYRGFWELDTVYHTYEEIIDWMDSLELQYPAICKKYYYGTSVGLRELSALKISDSVEHNQAEPEIAFDGGIHGDEIGGAENLIRFADHLCTNYGTDPDITSYIDNREIWIYPMVNPDGRVFMSRYNMNGVDLNRDWGYMWDAWGNSPDAYSQIETRALREFLTDHQFSIHTAYHSGLEMMLYPWYYREDDCPDYDAIAYLGLQYALQSGYTNLPNYSGYTAYNTNGTAAETYYGMMGSYGLTMEISEDKQPPVSQLMYYYNANLEPMLMLLEKGGFGIGGLVSDAINGNAVQARIYVEDFLPIYTDSILGDFHKFLVPGVYSIKAEANGYEPQVMQNVNVFEGSLTEINFLLNPLDSARQYAYRIISCQIPGNNWEDEGKTWEALGEPDSINYSIGKDGWIVIDMQRAVIDEPGNDIKVYEGDDSPEGYTIYGGTSMDGPWQLIGNAYGTWEFDFNGTGLISARYFKIQDDGGGQNNGPDIGFDLDAISDLEHADGINLVLSDILVDDSVFNNNGVIDAGETVDLLIEIVNYGGITADNINGYLQTSSSYINITQANSNFGSLASTQSSIGSFEVVADASTPIGEPVIFQLELTASGGSYIDNLEFEMIIGRFPVLIIDLDQNTNSGTVMESVLADMDIPSTYLTTMPDDLELYELVFVCLGVYGNAYSLSVSEGLELAAYLNNGGNIYMEGGDTWYFDEPTPVHPMFNIAGIQDGNGDLDFMLSVEGTFVEGMNYQYDGDNASIDRIIPVDEAFVLFYNQVPLYYTSIANDAGNYKTIGSVFEFGGLQDGAATKAELMYKILEFFGDIVTNTKENHIKRKLSLTVYPNPIKNQATILFNLNQSERVAISIYNLNGQRIRNLCDREFAEGVHKLHWDGTNQFQQKLPAGIYFVKMQVEGAVHTHKVAVME